MGKRMDVTSFVNIETVRNMKIKTIPITYQNIDISDNMVSASFSFRIGE
jgi:hypothetical protein